MKFVVKPSLEHIALVKIVVSLWGQNDVRVLISERYSSDLHSSEEWKTIEEKVIDKVPQLLLPQILKEKVLGFIKPIGLEVSMWIEYNQEYLVNLPDTLCWTSQGTVDRNRTAEVLVRDENLDISTRYKLACMYCLEDEILKFWNNMTEDLKESVSDEVSIIGFWSLYMKSRELGNTHISYKIGFALSALVNKVAAEYFLQRLTKQERKEYLVKTAKYVTDDDVLCFLLAEMNEQQQIEIFKYEPYSVLKCFLQWPLQSFFIGIANRMWDFLSKYDYKNILSEIIHKVVKGYKDYNYQKLFREFWQESPSALKSFITNKIHENWLLPPLFRIKDKENIRLILKDTTLAVKDKLIYSTCINIFCEHCISGNEWDALEFCIRECFPSKNHMLKFKEEFERRMMRSDFRENFATNKDKWNRLFQFSDNSNYDKSSVEDGESSSSKRFL